MNLKIQIHYDLHNCWYFLFYKLHKNNNILAVITRPPDGVLLAHTALAARRLASLVAL